MEDATQLTLVLLRKMAEFINYVNTLGCFKQLLQEFEINKKNSGEDNFQNERYSVMKSKDSPIGGSWWKEDCQGLKVS